MRTRSSAARNRMLKAACWIVVVALGVFALGGLAPAVRGGGSDGQGSSSGPQGAYENYDIRVDKADSSRELMARRRQGVPAKERAAWADRRHVRELAKARLDEKRGGLAVEAQALTGYPEIVTTNGRSRRFLTDPSRQARARTLRDFLGANRDLYGLTDGQVSALQTTADYVNPNRRLAWVEMRQTHRGRPVFQGELRAAFTSDGALVRTVGSLAPSLPDETASPAAAAQAESTKVSAAEAIVRGAESIGIAVDAAELVPQEASPDGAGFVYEHPAFAGPIKVELLYFPLAEGIVTPAWSMVLWLETPAYYVLVDADEGALLWRKNITSDQTAPATYRVYDADSPAPLSPTTALPGSGTQGAAIARTLFTLVSEGAAFNNLGWITDGGNTTTGNNVDAGLDLVAPDGIDAGARPVGSPLRTFDFPYDPAPGVAPPGEVPTLADYRWGEVTNMFFWSNRYHDRLYDLGFTEAARNFQQDNFGRGGLGGDRVLAQAQDFSGTNNANFSTPPDGSSGRMQMFIFTGPTPDRTSGLDQEIVIHELTHGTSNRLHSNGAGLGTTMSGGMGEGWSDFYALSLLSRPSDDPNAIYAMGGYSTLAITAGFTDNYYYGIRRFPYAVKTNVGSNGKPHNPLTFADIDPAQINLTDGAYPRGPIGSSNAFQVHNIGEVWASALWEARARIVGRLGGTAGNERMLQVVTDGMKLDPVNPTLLQGRNSILQADCAAFAGEDELDIWEGFAARGMGFSASAVSSSSPSVVEAFDVPNLTVGPVTVTGDSCDGGGFADPGETVTLNIPLTNPFCGRTATGAALSLAGGGSASYGDIGPGQTVTRAISYTVSTSIECGSVFPVEAQIESSLGSFTRTFDLQAGAPTGQTDPVEHSSGGLATPIPDLGAVEIPILVSDVGAVGDVDVSVRLNHTFAADLVLSLVAPDGTTVALANNRGGGGDNFGSGGNDCSGTPTTFDDSASVAISAGTAPFASTFRPESPLSVLNGKSMTGIWKLRVVDAASLDVGTIFCVTLRLRQQLYYCCGVPGTPIIHPVPPAVLTAECSSPANGAPDHGETVTMSFPLRNVGTGLTADLVATLLPGGGVVAPSGPQSYGVLSPVGPAASRAFSFTASGTCGSDITATFQLEDSGNDLGTVSFPIQIGATAAATATPANPAPITILDSPRTGGVAPSSPYPSSISVSGITGTVTKVTATLSGFSHTFPGDADVLLVGPGGERVLLMSDVGGGTDAVNATLVFDDAAATGIGSTIVSGTFRPTNSGAGDSFPAPAPGAPYSSALGVFDGLDPNGTWSLFVVDDSGIDSGSISGGWSLAITTEDPVCNTISAPQITGISASPSSLWPPNHTMRDVTVSYSSGATCASCTLSVSSNEPDNGTGDGDTAPDWEIVDDHHLRLRSERAGNGTGRIYTVTATCSNPVLGSSTASVPVYVAHNITSPRSGSAFRINTPVSFAGSFWDAPGLSHTARWTFDGLSTPGTVVEPTATSMGRVQGTYTFATPGVYKVRLELTGSNGVTSWVDTAGDLEALVVAYDPSGGYTAGGGYIDSPPGALVSNPGLAGKVGFGFSVKYRNATNPKGETQLSFALGNLRFNAVNFDYLAIPGARAQFKGFGKVNDAGAYNFLLSVIDGQATGGGGVDRFRMKIWNKTTGAVVYDSQMGASDAADPTLPVGAGGSVIVQK